MSIKRSDNLVKDGLFKSFFTPDSQSAYFAKALLLRSVANNPARRRNHLIRARNKWGWILLNLCHDPILWVQSVGGVEPEVLSGLG